MEIGKIYFAVYKSGVIIGGLHPQPIVFGNLAYITADEEKAKDDANAFCGYVKIMMTEVDGKFIIKELP